MATNANKEQRTAVIVGAGPAGLTAAVELLRRSDIRPVVIERDSQVGGISKTVNYKGNRIDLGGHRFFSKSDEVMNWWRDIMPIDTDGKQAPREDRVMMIRDRLSRIYFLRRFFNYPISLTWQTIRNLGFVRLVKVGCSYIRIRMFPIREEKSLEDFYINRFGRQLYKTFFKDYTHKVWGVECSNISPDWGSQRVKGLSITTALVHMARQAFSKKKGGDIEQKETETSLIEKFIYPKFGPGQLWEYVAQEIEQKGGVIMLESRVTGIHTKDCEVTAVTVTDKTGKETLVEGDYLISSMPVRELVRVIDAPVPENVRQVAEGLVYRDFMTAGLLLRKMNVNDGSDSKILPDTWIYIQEHDVKVGRLQIFNNWSPYMVASPDTVWVGLEYFVNQDDELWSMNDTDFARMAAGELEKIGLINKDDVLDSKVLRVEKAYPAYFGSYSRMNEIIEWVSEFRNLYLVGRNGQHRYNNMDHSMITAITAVEKIICGDPDKSDIWSVNTEQEYHENKKSS